MRLIDADKLMMSLNDNFLANSPTGNETLQVKDYRESVCEGLEIAMATVEEAPTVGGWINNYEWICPACGTSILVKTSKQSKAIGMKLSVCPGCGKEIMYGKVN